MTSISRSIFIAFLTIILLYSCSFADELQVPEIMTNKEVYARGEPVKFTVNMHPDAETMRIGVVYRLGDDHVPYIVDKEFYTPGSYTIIPKTEEEYDYCIIAIQTVNGEETRTEKKLCFSDVAVALWADNEEVVVGEKYCIHILAPEADRVVLYKRYNDSNEFISQTWNNGVSNEMVFDSIRLWTEEERQVYFRIEAYFGDQIICSETLKIVSIAPYGRLEDPVVEIPEKIVAGTNAEIKIHEIEHAEYYRVYISSPSEDVYSANFEASNVQNGMLPTINLHNGLTQVEGKYIIQIFAEGKGAYQCTYLQAFEVGERNKNVMFLPFRTEVLVNEYVSIYKYAPFAEAYRTIEYEERDGQRILVRDVGTECQGIDARIMYRWDTPGDKVLCFDVWFGDERVTKEAIFHVSAKDKLLPAEIIVPDNISGDESFPITINPVEFAEIYDIEIEGRRVDGDSVWINYNQPGQYTIEGENLIEGVYTISVSAKAKGYETSKSTKYCYSGEIDKTVEISAEKDTGELYEKIHLQVSAPFADYYIIKDDLTDEVLMDWTASEYEAVLQHAGRNVFGLYATFGKDVIHKSIEIYATTPHEKLEKPKCKITNEIKIGEDIYLDIEEVQNAECYLIETFIKYSDLYNEGYKFETTTPKETTISGIWMPFDGYCSIKVTARGKGYLDSEPCVISFWINRDEDTVDESHYIKASLPINLKRIDENAFESIVIERLILPYGIEKMGSYAFVNCKNLQYINLPDSLTYIAPDAFEGCDNLFIECSAGSLGEEFARAHGFYPVIK